jgi:diguanylate cyclase (GGDEF)-like protein
VGGWLRRSLARQLALASALTTGASLGVCALALQRHIASDLVLGFALVVLVAAGVWVSVRRVLVRPLRDLTATMGRAGQGDLLIRAPARATGELSELGRSFNQLLATLTDLRASMIDTERMVAVQQRELSLMEKLAEKERVLVAANQQMQQSLRELELLFDITRTINSTLDLGEVLRSICARVGETLGFEEFAILLYDEPTGRLVVRATYGFPPDEGIEDMSFSPGEGISGIVAKTGEWLLIPDTSRDTRYLHYKGRHLADGSFLCVPIKLQTRLVGLFNVLRPLANAFSEGDIRLLTSLANYAALALVNAQLHGRIKELSVTDELTSLANRRRLTERAGLELERAARFGHPVAAMMIDIDHFKALNDSCGHLKGDEVLRRVASILRSELRNVDLLARYGGEEFVALLPKTDKVEAVGVAQKLRAAIEAAPFDPKVTISIGVAAHPEDSRTVRDLVEASDRALFAAKRGGRNQVVAYSPALAHAPLVASGTASSHAG